MNNHNMSQRGNYNNIDQITLNKKINNLKQLLLSVLFPHLLRLPYFGTNSGGVHLQSSS